MGRSPGRFDRGRKSGSKWLGYFFIATLSADKQPTPLCMVTLPCTAATDRAPPLYANFALSPMVPTACSPCALPLPCRPRLFHLALPPLCLLAHSLNTATCRLAHSPLPMPPDHSLANLPLMTATPHYLPTYKPNPALGLCFMSLISVHRL